MNNFRNIFLIIILLSNNIFSEAEENKFRIKKVNGEITINGSHPKKGDYYSLKDTITFPPNNENAYLQLQFPEKFEFEEKKYTKVIKLFRPEPAQTKKITFYDIFKHKVAPTHTKGKYDLNIHEKFVEYMLNDTVLIDLYKQIDNKNKYTLVFSNPDERKIIKVDATPKSQTSFYFTKQQFEEKGIWDAIKKGGRCQIRYGNIIAIDYFYIKE